MAVDIEKMPPEQKARVLAFMQARQQAMNQADEGSRRPEPSTPTITAATTTEDAQTSDGLVISRSTADYGTTTHFRISGITGGTLYQNDGSTAIAAGDFITYAQGNAGLKFTPTANLNSYATTFTFGVQAASGTTVSDLGGAVVLASITVTPVADTPAITNSSTTMNTQTTTGLVCTRNAADGAEVTHFKVTAITNGTLFQNDGTTPILANAFITYAQGNAGLKFTPTTSFTGTGTVAIKAGTDNAGGGLSASAATANITVS